MPALREAVLAHQRERYGLEPEEVLITFGATEAIASALLGLCDPGDEAILIEPYYDSYGACIAFAGAGRRVVTLRPPDFSLDPEALSGSDRAGRRPGTRTGVELAAQPHGAGLHPRGDGGGRPGLRRARPDLRQRRGL